MTRRTFADIEAEAMADPVRRARIGGYQAAIEAALRVAVARDASGAGADEPGPEVRRDAGPGSTSDPEIGREAYLDALRDYVAELGGELRVTAVFPDMEVTLVGE